MSDTATMPMPARAPDRRRHWRQRFDANAEFIFIKRLKLGLDPENPWVNPGDVVPRGTFHINRLRIWWRAKVIAIKDWIDPAERARAEAYGVVLSAPVPTPAVTYYPVVDQVPHAPVVPQPKGEDELAVGDEIVVEDEAEDGTQADGARVAPAGDQAPAKPQGSQVERPSTSPLAPLVARVEPTGGGWFTVTIDGVDGAAERVRGRAAVDKLLGELGAVEAPGSAQDAASRGASEDPAASAAAQTAATGAATRSESATGPGDEDESEVDLTKFENEQELEIEVDEAVEPPELDGDTPPLGADEDQE